MRALHGDRMYIRSLLANDVIGFIRRCAVGWNSGRPWAAKSSLHSRRQRGQPSYFSWKNNEIYSLGVTRRLKKNYYITHKGRKPKVIVVVVGCLQLAIQSTKKNIWRAVRLDDYTLIGRWISGPRVDGPTFLIFLFLFFVVALFIWESSENRRFGRGNWQTHTQRKKKRATPANKTTKVYNTLVWLLTDLFTW